MPVVKLKPTSPGRRAMVKVVNPALHKGRPIAALTESKKRGSGRNNLGHITVRHRGGAHKRQYRLVDFRLAAVREAGDHIIGVRGVQALVRGVGDDALPADQMGQDLGHAGGLSKFKFAERRHAPPNARRQFV